MFVIVIFTASHPSLHSNVYELPYDQKSVTMPFVRTPYTGLYFFFVADSILMI